MANDIRGKEEKNGAGEILVGWKSDVFAGGEGEGGGIRSQAVIEERGTVFLTVAKKEVGS